MNFDEQITRTGTHSVKWDNMEDIYGVPSEGGLPMWVADMDFQPPQAVQDALQRAVGHGILGYTNYDKEYRAAICWWMKTRHNWEIDPSWIFTTTGLVNACGICLDAYTDPGDSVVLFTPVYHAFAKVIKLAGRKVKEMPMVIEDGQYKLDFGAYDALLDGSEKMMIFCSPHNPGGRVWTRDELQQAADFAERHDLLLVSDEVHHDLVYSGTHLPMCELGPDVKKRTVMLTAPSKTFNIAGLHCGQAIIPDDALRAKFAERMQALYICPNMMGQFATAACYSPEGAEWADALVDYLRGNREVFDAALNAIPGVKSMDMQSTYLAWVDFSGTGMSREEFTRRVEQDAKIAANHGTTFGTGGELFLRFNLGTPRANVEEACKRLAEAFADLQ
jgi:cystathionine beta-lyase